MWILGIFNYALKLYEINISLQRTDILFCIKFLSLDWFKEFAKSVQHISSSLVMERECVFIRIHIHRIQPEEHFLCINYPNPPILKERKDDAKDFRDQLTNVLIWRYTKECLAFIVCSTSNFKKPAFIIKIFIGVKRFLLKFNNINLHEWY